MLLKSSFQCEILTFIIHLRFIKKHGISIDVNPYFMMIEKCVCFFINALFHIIIAFLHYHDQLAI